MRQSGGLEKQMHFDHQEDSKIESSSFNSEVKRIETQQTFNSSSTIIRRDRGASGVSGTSQNSERTTQIMRVQEGEDNDSTYNSLLTPKLTDKRMQTQQNKKTATEL